MSASGGRLSSAEYRASQRRDGRMRRLDGPRRDCVERIPVRACGRDAEVVGRELDPVGVNAWPQRSTSLSTRPGKSLSPTPRDEVSVRPRRRKVDARLARREVRRARGAHRARSLLGAAERVQPALNRRTKISLPSSCRVLLRRTRSITRPTDRWSLSRRRSGSTCASASVRALTASAPVAPSRARSPLAAAGEDLELAVTRVQVVPSDTTYTGHWLIGCSRGGRSRSKPLFALPSAPRPSSRRPLTSLRCAVAVGQSEAPDRRVALELRLGGCVCRSRRSAPRCACCRTPARAGTWTSRDSCASRPGPVPQGVASGTASTADAEDLGLRTAPCSPGRSSSPRSAPWARCPHRRRQGCCRADRRGSPLTPVSRNGAPDRGLPVRRRAPVRRSPLDREARVCGREHHEDSSRSGLYATDGVLAPNDALPSGPTAVSRVCAPSPSIGCCATAVPVSSASSITVAATSVFHPCATVHPLTVGVSDRP